MVDKRATVLIFKNFRHLFFLVVDKLSISYCIVTRCTRFNAVDFLLIGIMCLPQKILLVVTWRSKSMIKTPCIILQKACSSYFIHIFQNTTLHDCKFTCSLVYDGKWCDCFYLIVILEPFLWFTTFLCNCRDTILNSIFSCKFTLILLFDYLLLFYGFSIRIDTVSRLTWTIATFFLCKYESTRCMCPIIINLIIIGVISCFSFQFFLLFL